MAEFTDNVRLVRHAGLNWELHAIVLTSVQGFRWAKAEPFDHDDWRVFVRESDKLEVQWGGSWEELLTEWVRPALDWEAEDGSGSFLDPTTPNAFQLLELAS